MRRHEDFCPWALIITTRVQDWEKHVAEVAIARSWWGSLTSPLVIVERRSTRYRRNMGAVDKNDKRAGNDRVGHATVMRHRLGRDSTGSCCADVR